MVSLICSIFQRSSLPNLLQVVTAYSPSVRIRRLGYGGYVIDVSPLRILVLSGRHRLYTRIKHPRIAKHRSVVIFGCHVAFEMFWLVVMNKWHYLDI